MNKEAFLKETYNSAFNDELEKLAKDDSKLKKALIIGGTALTAGLIGAGLLKKRITNIRLKNLKNTEDIANKVINIKSSLRSDREKFLSMKKNVFNKINKPVEKNTAESRLNNIRNNINNLNSII